MYLLSASTEALCDEKKQLLNCQHVIPIDILELELDITFINTGVGKIMQRWTGKLGSCMSFIQERKNVSPTLAYGNGVSYLIIW